MSIFSNYFPLGLGTSRFAINNPGDSNAIDKAAELVCKALDAGVNYIDTSYIYSAGAAQTALGNAFRQTDKSFDVTVKVIYDADKTADEARRRAELQLKTMGLQKAAFFVCWTLWGYGVFEKVMRSGGIYDGAVRMKDEGIVDHICCSIHAPPDEIIRVIESGAFEGITLSYSLLNANLMQPVLDCALKHDVGVAIMNPLGGGLVAQNPDFFSFARNSTEDNTVVSALRFVKAHPAVNIILSGIANENELYENLTAVRGEGSEPDKERLARVLTRAGEIKGFCTGCEYCKGCPADVPISSLMQKRNKLLLDCQSMYNRTDPYLVENLGLFYELGGVVPETAENPCVRCGACEKKCTQNLPIMDSIADTFARADKSRYSLASRRERLRELLFNKGYTKVGLYPNGGFSNLIMEMYDESFGKPEFEWIQFNSDAKMWGEMSSGVIIRSPDDIENIRPDIIIVCTYRYDSVIYNSLAHHKEKGIKVVKLHEEDDVPWVW